MRFLLTKHTAIPKLSVLHRLAILYLMLPVLIWLLGWFHWWLGVPATALLAFALWPVLSGSWRVSLRPATLALLLVAAGWVMLTAAGGVFDINNFDWPKHRALFLDLSRSSWPTYLPSYFSTYYPLMILCCASTSATTWCQDWPATGWGRRR